MERFLNRGVVVFLLVGLTLTVAGLAISRSFWVEASRVNELVCSVRLGGERYRLTLVPQESRVSASLFGPSGLDWSTNPAAEFDVSADEFEGLLQRLGADRRREAKAEAWDTLLARVGYAHSSHTMMLGPPSFSVIATNDGLELRFYASPETEDFVARLVPAGSLD